MAARIAYERLDFTDAEGFDALARPARGHRREQGTAGNHLYYLATQPSAFAEIVAQLGRVGLDHERHDGGWRRIIIEKPFGHDLESAIRLNREVGKVFRESQVYRIDHYLGKETVRNLLVFRFGNGIFEPIWNRRHIDHVQITVAESIGVENRGAFYEETGASRDFLQNHLLQLLSLVAMEPPATFEADALRDEKVKVMRAVERLVPEGPARRRPRPVRPGLGRAAKRSPATARSRRWTRSPRPRRSLPRASRSTTGAGAASRSTSAAASACRSGRPRSRSSSRRSRTGCSASVRRPEPNLLAMRIQPDEGIMLRFGAKVPGLGIDVRSVNMDFTYGSAFTVDSPEAYETLILDALLGDASLFTRADEVEAAWSIVTPIIEPGADEPPRLPELRGRHVGPREPTSSWPAMARRWRRICGTSATSASPPRPKAAGPRRHWPEVRWGGSDGGRRRPAGRVRARRRPAVGRPRLARPAPPRSRASRWSSRGSGPSRPTSRHRRNDGVVDRHVGARTSVMNLVVVARRPETGERCAAIIHDLTGRHPSRTLIVSPADPDGPSWLDAQHPGPLRAAERGAATETCAETIYLTCGGEAGRHLEAIVAPLLIHDLPVTLWWPASRRSRAVRPTTSSRCRDRLVVDGSTWRGDGLARSVSWPSSATVPADRDPRLRARPPVALARGDRVGLRPARLPALSAVPAADRGHVRDAR